ncbi:MAG: hypothetical protein LBD64_02520, partial [Odoribacteraceae bacterium]|nr:hypothetical protein [Odoribacteraceae bacterium]
MKKNNPRTSIVHLLLLSLLAACSSGDEIPTRDEILAIEKQRIHLFLAGKTYSSFPHEGTDIYGNPFRDTIRVLNNDATGTRPADKQFVLVDYDEMALNGNYIASTDPARFIGEDIAAPYTLGGPLYFPVDLPADAFPDPLSRALAEMSEGTTGEMLLSSLLAARAPGNYFYARFKIWRVIPDILEYEKQLVRSYVDDLEVNQNVAPGDIIEEKSAVGDSLLRVIIFHCKTATGDSIAAFSSAKIKQVLYLLNEPDLVSPPGFLTRKVHEVTDDISSTAFPALFREGIHRLREG